MLKEKEIKMIDTNELRKMGQAVYVLAEKEVRKGLSDKLYAAADEIDKLREIIRQKEKT